MFASFCPQVAVRHMLVCQSIKSFDITTLKHFIPPFDKDGFDKVVIEFKQLNLLHKTDLLHKIEGFNTNKYWKIQLKYRARYYQTNFKLLLTYLKIYK